MGDLTTAERESLADALRACRVEDAPVPLIHDADIFHVTHMVSQAAAQIIADRETALREEIAAAIEAERRKDPSMYNVWLRVDRAIYIARQARP